MAMEIGGGGEQARTFMISAGLVFEIIAAFCSSPQTAEINADKRSETLMKWVGLGLILSAVFVAIAAIKLKGGPAAVWGGLAAGAAMGVAYVHANSSGLKSPARGTETY